jgi:hypothetical protein
VEPSIGAAAAVPAAGAPFGGVVDDAGAVVVPAEVAAGAPVALCVEALADAAVAGAFAELALADPPTAGTATAPPTDADAAGAFAVALLVEVA